MGNAQLVAHSHCLARISGRLRISIGEVLELIANVVRDDVGSCRRGLWGLAVVSHLRRRSA